MGSQVARNVPEKLLGLLDAFSYDASAHSLSELARAHRLGHPSRIRPRAGRRDTRLPSI